MQRIEVDCATGKEVAVPLTAAERASLEQRQAAAPPAPEPSPDALLRDAILAAPDLDTLKRVLAGSEVSARVAAQAARGAA